MELKSNEPDSDWPIEEAWTKHKFHNLKLVNPANRRKFNIIVVGSGLAGSSSAASLADTRFGIGKSFLSVSGVFTKPGFITLTSTFSGFKSKRKLSKKHTQ